MHKADLYPLAVEYILEWRKANELGTMSLHDFIVKKIGNQELPHEVQKSISEIFDELAIRQSDATTGNLSGRWV